MKTQTLQDRQWECIIAREQNALLATLEAKERQLRIALEDYTKHYRLALENVLETGTKNTGE